MNTYVGWVIVLATCAMTATCVVAFGMWSIQRRAMIRYWSGKT